MDDRFDDLRLISIDIYIHILYTIYHFENALLNIWNDLGCHYWRSHGWPNTCSLASSLAQQEGVSFIEHGKTSSINTDLRCSVDYNGLNWLDMGIDWAAAYSKGMAEKTSTTASVAAVTPTTTAAAVVAATTTAAPVATTSASTGAILAQVESDVESLLAGLVGLSNKLTSFGEPTTPSGALGDNYIGNVGNPYASNIILVSDASKYSFTNTFHNSQSKSIVINVWQKVGPDMRPLSGSALAPTKTSLTFVLAPGASKTVAFQANTQVGWAEACSKTTASGSYDTTWGEFNAVPGGSGYDVSAIMNSANNNYDMTITSVEAPCKSSRTENMWLTATEPIGTSDGSCYIMGDTATLTTVMGGYVS